MGRRLLARVGLATTLLSAAIGCGVSAAEPPFQSLSFNAALRKARDEQKLVVIDFFTTWCPPCKMLDRATWPDPNVQSWLSAHAVALKINAEDERKLALRFEVRAYPTIVFVRSDGTMIDSLEGFRGAAQFLEEAALVLDGKSTSQRLDRRLEANADDLMGRFDRARARARSRNFEGAFRDLMICWDSSSSDEREQLLSRELASVANAYAPARAELTKRRDEIARRLEGDEAVPRRDASELAVLGVKVLDDFDGTLAVLAKLRWRENQKEASGAIAHVVLEKVVESGRWREA